jgi:putative membrane protein
MKILFWIIALPLLALAGAFAAANPQAVTLHLWPLPFELEMPVYAAVLGALGLGLVVAALYGWISNLSLRWDRRRHVRHERQQEEEIARLRSELEESRRAPRTDDEDTQARRRALIAQGD